MPEMARVLQTILNRYPLPKRWLCGLFETQAVAEPSFVLKGVDLHKIAESLMTERIEN